MNAIAGTSMIGVLGQLPGAEVATSADSVALHSIWDFIVKGGPMMVPLAVCSLLALAVIVERLISLRRSRIIPPGFIEGLKVHLRSGPRAREAALDYCRSNGSPIASILFAGIARLGKPISVIRERICEAGERETVKLRKYLRLLSVVASIAPLMGLLGTIFGMIRAFQTVALAGEALGKTEVMAKGIYEAMITTAAGLIVAIPVLVCYHWISGRVEQFVLEMDLLTIEFVEEQEDEITNAEVPVSESGIAQGSASTEQLAAVVS